jgi:DNA-binding LacI/PurR family transcriptional regulator
MTKPESLPTYDEMAKRARVSTKTVCNVFRTPGIVRSNTANKVHNDHITNALYPLLTKRGTKPGKDIHIISCNADQLFLTPLHPRPASIDIHPAEIGRRGVDQLLWRMENKDDAPSTILIRPRLVPGEEGL